jgi:hypothetical protein
VPQIDARVREGAIKPREGVELQNFYEQVLHGYTYIDYEKQAKALQDAVNAGNRGQETQTPSNNLLN